MIDINRLPEAIQWHEGMLLAPHHFQQTSRRQEELLHYHLFMLSPYHYGVSRLKINESLLMEGILRITELEAVLPDGLVVYLFDGEEEITELDLTDFDKEKVRKQALTVYATVQDRHMTSSIASGFSRYKSVESRPVFDESTGESEMSIPRLRPVIRLYAEENNEPPPDRFVALPLMKIGFRNEVYTLSDEESLIPFIPPHMKVLRGSDIWNMCNNVINRIKEKGVVLFDQKGIDPETRTLIRGLVSPLPLLETLLNSASHPYHIFLSLCRLIGCAALRDKIPKTIPYMHDDLRRTFDQATRFILDMVEDIMETHMVIEFRLGDGVFSLEKLRNDWISDWLLVGVRGGDRMKKDRVETFFNDCMIGSEPIIESMQDKRVLGPERRPVSSEEEKELSPPKDIILFKVKADEEFIIPDEGLQIFDPGAKPGPSEMKLYVKKQ